MKFEEERKQNKKESKANHDQIGENHTMRAI
jgi:hypothetical protein